MADAFVQGTGVQGTSTALTQAKAFASNVTAGNLIVVGVVTDRTGATTNSVADNLLNSYVSARSFLLGTRDRLEIFYAKNVTGGACTVTATAAASAFISVMIAEASGADTATQPDNANDGTGTGTAAANGNVTVAAAGEIVFGFVTQTGTTTTITPDAGFNEIFEDEAATGMPINWAYKLVSADTAPSWTLGLSRTWGTIAATFKAAAAAVASDGFAGPAQIPNRRVGPQVLRQRKQSPVPVDLTQAPVTDAEFGVRVRLPNNRVGPPVLRQAWRSTPQFDTTLAAPTDDHFAVPARMPNNRVGPMALRALYRPAAYPFDSTVSTATGNRLRRLVCSGA